MESSHLVIFSTSGKFITKFNVLRCISLSETLFWTGARGRIPITLRAFIGVETAALTFRTKQYSTSTAVISVMANIFLNHNKIALVRNFLKITQLCGH